MKKGLSLGIVILMTALLCACGEETSKEGGETGNGAAGAANTENAWNIYTYSEAENGNRITSNDYAVSSEEELADLLKNAETELQLPSYIPSGYEFERKFLLLCDRRNTGSGRNLGNNRRQREIDLCLYASR